MARNRRTHGIRRSAATRGKVSPSKVKEAIELASKKERFEVVYYPNVAQSNFLVKEGAVDNALETVWFPGMTVKRAVETEDSTKLRWIQGKINSIIVNNDLSPWPGTPWRVIQIKWDEPEVLKNFEWVSPWQVVLVTTEL